MIERIVQAEEILKAADELPNDQFRMRALNQQIRSLAKDIEKYAALKEKLYQDMTEGVVGSDEDCRSPQGAERD